MAKSPLSDYYKKANLSPVEHDISDPEKFAYHRRKRLNLLEYCLKLPTFSFRNSKVLEFGPGSSENGVLLAELGARLTFVEPVDFLIEKLRDNFAALRLETSIDEIHQNTVESFFTDKKFDFVIAEGFLHFLDDQISAVKKLCYFVDKGGFLFISLVHPSGTFVEFVKRAYLLWMIQRTGTRTRADALEHARSLFQEDFDQTNHSRGFESWTGDTVLNPLYRLKNFASLETLLQALPDNFYIYSSWPNVENLDDLVWHKNVKDVKRLNQEILNSYFARYPHFIHGIPRDQAHTQLFSPTLGRALAREFEECLTFMDRQLDHHFSEIESLIARLDTVADSHKKTSEGQDSAKVLRAAADLFRATLKKTSRIDFVTAYKQNEILRKTWGCPGHYYVAQHRNF